MFETYQHRRPPLPEIDACRRHPSMCQPLQQHDSRSDPVAAATAAIVD
jgi:hypothetical protein